MKKPLLSVHSVAQSRRELIQTLQQELVALQGWNEFSGILGSYSATTYESMVKGSLTVLSSSVPTLQLITTLRLENKAIERSFLNLDPYSTPLSEIKQLCEQPFIGTLGKDTQLSYLHQLKGAITVLGLPHV